ncbi:MAG: DUF4091 domain-containing protein [Clostridiales bacterium]|nr:DUF4091 domain-containing protein [Clostridiales bacterium]
MVKLKWVSALEKVFADEEPKDYPDVALTGFQNEVHSLQAAWCVTDDASEQNDPRQRVRLTLDSAVPARVRRVTNVPVRFPCFPVHVGGYLRTTPGLYPDLLEDVTTTTHLRAYVNIWSAVWIDLEPTDSTKPGQYPLSLRMEDLDGNVLAEQTFSVEILPGALPPQEIIQARWLHADCLAQYYHVPVFSDEHFAILERFIAHAVRRGVNMMLVPAHTPPLDTAVGGERLTTQLVGVARESGRYVFDFALLARYVDICKRAGVTYYEIAHLFTQWGAYHAPKIVATVDGKPQRIFGWDTDATGNSYKAFLDVYLPALTAELRRLGIAGRTYFHISDEPSKAHIDQYLAAKALVTPHLKGFKIIDALSDVAFYESGAVPLPIPASNHMDAFLKADIPERWTYYCVGQHWQVSNTFIAMPAARTRIIGAQMYRFGITGFLQWAYNFYNSQYSEGAVNPFLITDADGFAPAGDAFQVYPGEGGVPLDSLRLMLFHHALQDNRALLWAEALAGRERVLAELEQGLDTPLSFTEYPMDEVYLLSLRERVNRLIAERTKPS